MISGGTINLGGTSPTINVATAGVTATVSSVLKGTAGLTLTGAGTLVLTGINNYGPTTINGAILIVGSSLSLGNGSVTINGGSLGFSFNSATVTNKITVGANGGAIFNANAGTTITLSTSVGASGTVNGSFTLGGAGNLVLNAGISGSFSAVTVNSSGGSVKFASASYSGPTIVSAGTLQGVVPSSTTVTLGSGSSTAGTFDLDASSTTVAGLATGNSGNASINVIGNSATGISTLTFAGGATASTFAGTIQNAIGSGTGAVNLTINGGTLSLTGANTYSSGTLIKSGQLNIGSPTAIGTGTLTIDGGVIDNTSAGPITLTNNNQQIWAGNFTFNGTQSLNLGTGAVSLSLGIQITVQASTLTVGGVISGNGLVKLGAGTLALTNNNPFLGSSNTIGAGTLQLGSAGALPSAVSLVLGSGAATGGTLDLNGLTVTIGDLSTGNSGSPSVNVIGSSSTTANSTLIVANAQPSTFGGVIQDQLGAGSMTLALASKGSLTLTGANTYSGGTSINGGVLTVSNDGNLGTGPLTFAGGALQISSGASFASTKNITINSGVNATIDPNSSAIATFGGAISGGGGLTATGAGTVILTGPNNTYSGGTTIISGNLQVGNGSQSGSLPGNVTSNGTLAFDPTSSFVFAGAISGTGVVNVLGGTTIFTSALNTYSGRTTIAGGTLQIGNGTLSGSLPGSVTDNGLLVFNPGGNFTASNGISGSGSVQISSGVVTLSGINGYQGNTIVSAGVLRPGNSSSLPVTTTVYLGSGVSTGGTLDLNGQTVSIAGLATANSGNPAVNVIGSSSTAASAQIKLYGGAASFTFGGIIQDQLGSGTTPVTLTVNSGTLTLTGANTYSGGTLLYSGQLNLNSTSAIGTGGFTSQGGTIDNTSSGPITLTTNNLIMWGGSITFKGTQCLNLGTGEVVLGGAQLTVTANTLTLGGFISGGSTTLTKLGAGTLVFGNSSLNPAATTIAAGTVQLSGRTYQIGPFVVQAGAILSVVNPVSTATDRMYSTLTFGAAAGDATTLNLNAASDWAPGAPPLLTVNGNLTANGGFASTTINVSTSATLSLGTYNLISYGTNTGLPIQGTGFSAFTLAPVGSSRVIATLQNIGSMIQMNVTGFDSPKWTGAVNSVWDINATANWQLIAQGTPTTYLQGDSVLFDDTATGTTNITLSTVVTPAATTFNNNNLTYTISGSGQIGGSGALTQNGSGIVYLQTANAYSGGTLFNAGTISVAADNSLGTGPLTFNGGALQITGSSPFVSAKNITLNGGGGTLDIQNGAGSTFNGAITGGGGLTKIGPGTLILGGTSTYGGPTTVTDGTLVVTGVLGSGSVSGGALTIGQAGSLAGTGTINLSTNVGSSAGGGLIRGGISDGTNNYRMLTLSSPGATVTASLTLYGAAVGSGGGATLLAEVSRTGPNQASSSFINITNGSLNLGGQGSSALGISSGNFINIQLIDTHGSLAPGENYTFALATASNGVTLNGGAVQNQVIDSGGSLSGGGPTLGNSGIAALSLTGNAAVANQIVGWSLSVDSSGGNLELTFSSVPESEHVTLISAGALLAGFAVRRRYIRKMEAAISVS